MCQYEFYDHQYLYKAQNKTTFPIVYKGNTSNLELILLNCEFSADSAFWLMRAEYRKYNTNIHYNKIHNKRHAFTQNLCDIRKNIITISRFPLPRFWIMRILNKFNCISCNHCDIDQWQRFATTWTSLSR